MTQCDLLISFRCGVLRAQNGEAGGSVRKKPREIPRVARGYCGGVWWIRDGDLTKNAHRRDRADDGAHPGGLVRDGMRNRARRRKARAPRLGGCV